MMARTKQEGLSEKHQRVLEAIKSFTEKRGYPPTIREICERAKLSSTSVVNYYLEYLEEKGYIERDRGVSRGVRLAKQLDTLIPIPLIGPIVAGKPVPIPTSDFSLYDPESAAIKIARSMLPGSDSNIKDLYALEVRGDSMIDAMINDGDIVIMKKTHQARNGEMVAIWLNDKDETTLKYFFDEGHRVRLQPANPTMEPIYVDDPATVEIHGKVVMVVRQVDIA